MLYRYILLIALAASPSFGADRAFDPSLSWFRSGWSVEISHVGPGGGRSAKTFASVNDRLDLAMRERFKEFRVECSLVPRGYGYDIIVLSTKPLGQTESKEIKALVEKLLPRLLGNKEAKMATDNFRGVVPAVSEP